MEEPKTKKEEKRKKDTCVLKSMSNDCCFKQHSLQIKRHFFGFVTAFCFFTKEAEKQRSESSSSTRLSRGIGQNVPPKETSKQNTRRVTAAQAASRFGRKSGARRCERTIMSNTRRFSPPNDGFLRRVPFHKTTESHTNSSGAGTNSSFSLGHSIDRFFLKSEMPQVSKCPFVPLSCFVC